MNTLDSISKIDAKMQDKLLNIFVKVDIPLKLKILHLQTKFFHRLKTIHNKEDKEILMLASLFLAIQNITKNTENTALNASKIRKNNKQNRKQQKILGFWAVIRKLKNEENMSFREISNYFLKYHRLHVSYSLIYQMWSRLENNEMKEQ